MTAPLAHRAPATRSGSSATRDEPTADRGATSGSGVDR
ncbi:hypothetical protein JOE68_002371 [Saccharothrix algeriensis]|uniref:Uncharacterized protein n=1 Tax=Saccharothrix algeriensis TaxID=173560 RepID=A0ABS2S5K3_9PSEU|nr:hypothetical protein [Saccharothrix algeriensis]